MKLVLFSDSHGNVANMADVVRVGEQGLIGEVLTMNGDTASIQVYEETSGLGPGAEVVTTGAPLSFIWGIWPGMRRSWPVSFPIFL